MLLFEHTFALLLRIITNIFENKKSKNARRPLMKIGGLHL